MLLVRAAHLTRTPLDRLDESGARRDAADMPWLGAHALVCRALLPGKFVLHLDSLPGHNSAPNSRTLRFTVKGPSGKPLTTEVYKAKQTTTVKQPFTVAAGKLTKITPTTEIIDVAYG